LPGTFLRESLPEHGRDDRMGCIGSWLAGSVRVSQRRVLAPSLGWERLPPLEYADCGQWWALVAGLTSRPAELSSAVFRPRWAGWRPRYPEVVSGPSSGPRVAPGPAAALRPGPWCCGPGCGRVAAGVRGALDSWLPAAVPGRLCAAVQPAVGGLSTAESGGLTPWWVSESVCLYRKPMADSSNWMRGSTCRSASLGVLEAAIPGGGLRAIARASGVALCPAQRPGPRPR
jgi:hypothetical protein